MAPEIRNDPAAGAPDHRRTDPERVKPRRFRVRIRDWLVAIALVALVAAGLSQLIRERRLQVERELARAIRMQEAAAREQEALLRSMGRLQGGKQTLDGPGRLEAKPDGRRGMISQPDPRGLPDTTRTVD